MINTTLLPAKKCLEQVRDKIRYKHYSLSTENTYISWIKQYMLFNSKRHPTEMGAAEVEKFFHLSGDQASCVQFHSESGIIGDSFFVS